MKVGTGVRAGAATGGRALGEGFSTTGAGTGSGKTAGFGATGAGLAGMVTGIFAVLGAGFFATGAGAGAELAFAAGVLSWDVRPTGLALSVVETTGLAGGTLAWGSGAFIGLANGAAFAAGRGGTACGRLTGADDAGDFLAMFLREGILAIAAAT